MEAFDETRSGLADIVQWVFSQERHSSGGTHYHMAVKLSHARRWLRVRNYLDDNHSIQVNFSSVHSNYYSAWRYTTKETISFSATIAKFYKFGFSKPFLKWLLSYLSGHSQFVQIDDRKSSYQSAQFSVPQGSFLGPMIFNLFVSDLHEVTPPSMECVQYADETSLYSHFNVKELDSRAVDMNETLVSITNWSQDSNLALNRAKTKCMLFLTPQMSSYHFLAERPIHLSVGDKPLECAHY